MSEPTTPNEGSSTMTGTDRTARITWSLIAEPSDLIAFGVCAALGPAGALELARHGDATALLRALDGELPSQATDPERAQRRFPGRSALSSAGGHAWSGSTSTRSGPMPGAVGSASSPRTTTNGRSCWRTCRRPSPTASGCRAPGGWMPCWAPAPPRWSGRGPPPPTARTPR